MGIFCKEFKPFTLVSLEQIRFWLHVMKDHAIFIKAGLGCEETALREEADRFYSQFEALEKMACKADCDDFMDLLGQICPVVKRFFAFKRHLLHLALECSVVTHNPALFYDHISREAMYFLELLERTEECLKYPVDSMTGETVFWTKIMADHLMFILANLDPSERQLADKAVCFNKMFNELNLQTRDFDSMLWRFTPVNSFGRLVEDVEVNTEQLRDFKEEIANFLKQCCVNAQMPAEMAEHVTREAEYFLDILSIIDSQLTDCETTDCD